MKKLSRITIFYFLFSSILINSNLGQITSREIDMLVEDAMVKFTVAGVAVGIVKDGKIIHSKGYGVRSIETAEKVNEHTSFAIASNSKAFTTTALALLVEEGKLSWQDRVIDHIPEFKMYNDYVTRNFIIQDLLTHRSGLGLGAGDLQIWPSGSDFTMVDILTNFEHFEPVSPFRTKYDYDNILYLVAGELIKFLRPGVLVGGPGVHISGKYHYTVVAEEDTQACFIEIDNLKKVLYGSNDFLNKYLELCSQNYGRKIERMVSLSHKQMHGRIADALLYLSDQIFKSNKITRQISRKDIADYTAMAKDSAIRILKEFERDKIITLDGRTIEILDNDRLKSISING